MNHIKSYKIYESEGWNKDVDWKYVIEHPDDKSDEASLIRDLQEKLDDVISMLDNYNIFEIVNIKGNDLDYGSYAIVSIFDKNYKISEVYSIDKLCIEDFPINNPNEDETTGYIGDTNEIAELLNMIYKSGGMEIYQSIKKYNI